MVKTPKSKRFRKIFVKTPGGKVKVHFRKTKPAKAKCAGCGKILAGVPRERPHKMRKMGRTKKRPQRLYGGQLCSQCSRRRIIESIRK